MGQIKYCFIVCQLLVVVSCSSRKDEIINAWRTDRQKFDLLVKEISSEKALWHIDVSALRRSGVWQSINHWNFRPGYDSSWWCWNSELGHNQYLSNFEQVLTRNYVSMSTYCRYRDFLLENKFDELTRFDASGSYFIEIERGLMGLRFQDNDLPSMKMDSEYSYVVRLDSQWYYYERDWN